MLCTCLVWIKVQYMLTIKILSLLHSSGWFEFFHNERKCYLSYKKIHLKTKKDRKERKSTYNPITCSVSMSPFETIPNSDHPYYPSWQPSNSFLCLYRHIYVNVSTFILSKIGIMSLTFFIFQYTEDMVPSPDSF